MSETVTLSINDREYTVPAGSRLIDVLGDRAGLEIPRFCYHRDLPVVGSCRMCQVEIEATGPGGIQRRALAISCRTPVAQGMKVWTHTEPAVKARQGVLEFLLKDHPLDCPICDKAGECPLQDYTFQEGQREGRSHDPRRKREKRKSLGEVIVLDQERCVLCTRCVRFFPAVDGSDQLQVQGLGNRSVIDTFEGRPLSGNYQGNLADICPVGALTLKKFRFQARSWNLQPVPSTCVRCSRGCAVLLDAYRGRIVRVRPRYDARVNKSWMCDYGRFGFDDLNLPGRLGTALLGPPEAPRALAVEEGLETAREWLRAAGEEAFLLASPFLTLEEAEAFREMAGAFGARAFFLAPELGGGDGVLKTDDPCPNRLGLQEAGLDGLDPQEARERLAAAPLAFLAGQYVLHLLHGVDTTETAPEFPPLETRGRTILLDTHLRDGFELLLPARTWAEKHGRVLNLDGLERVLRPALAPPEGIPEASTLFHRIALLDRPEGPVPEGSAAGIPV